MGFFKGLGPRSRSAHKNRPASTAEDGSSVSEHSADSTNVSDQSNGGVSTPGSSLPSSASTTSIPKLTSTMSSNTVPQRPNPMSAPSSSWSKRRSMSNFASSTAQSPKLSEGFYAPRIVNIPENQWVHTKLLLLRGLCGEPAQRPLDGKIIVTHHNEAFPSTVWPVNAGQFKAQVYLSPGPNVVRLEFFSQKLADNNGSTSLQRRDFRVNYLPMNNSPPLRLAILMGRDSASTFDATPERVQAEGNNLGVAIKKFRMGAQLMQSLVADKMRQEGMGRRCFRFEEEWTDGTLSAQDEAACTMRNEPVVHLVRADKTVAELRAMSLKPRGEELLLQVALDSLDAYFQPSAHQTHHFAMMLLDTHWEPAQQALAGHAAIAGGNENIKVALYGSHALQSYPACLEHVVPAFEDCTRTNNAYVANAGKTSGTNWEAVNTALWGHLREVSRMFGCDEQKSGLMCPMQAPRFTRAFVTREPFSTSEQSKGLKPVMLQDEVGWCLPDYLRFRCHPVFRMATDPAPQPDSEIQFWPVNDKRVIALAKNGIAFVEVYGEGDSTATLFKEYVTMPPPVPGTTPPPLDLPKSLTLTESDLRSRLPKGNQKRRLRVVVHSGGTGKAEIPDIGALFEKKDLKLKMSNGNSAYRGPRLGKEQERGERQDLILHNTVDTTKLLQSIRVFFDEERVYGIEFLFEGHVSQIFGHRGDTSTRGVEARSFDLDTRMAEIPTGFQVRFNEGVQALAVQTSHGRLSRWFGNQHSGGAHHTLQTPPSYSLAGVSGCVDTYITSFSVLIKR